MSQPVARTRLKGVKQEKRREVRRAVNSLMESLKKLNSKGRNRNRSSSNSSSSRSDKNSKGEDSSGKFSNRNNNGSGGGSISRIESSSQPLAHLLDFERLVDGPHEDVWTDGGDAGDDEIEETEEGNANIDITPEKKKMELWRPDKEGPFLLKGNVPLDATLPVRVGVKFVFCLLVNDF
jgi:hypothetical protein